MKKALSYSLALMLTPAMPIAHAQESNQEFPYTDKWQPFYQQCFTKLELQNLVPMRIINSTRTAEEQESLTEFYEETEQAAKNLCACITNKSEQGVSDSFYEVSDRDIRSFAQAFRYESPYPDPNLGQLIAVATYQCGMLAYSSIELDEDNVEEPELTSIEPDRATKIIDTETDTTDSVEGEANENSSRRKGRF